MFFIKELSQYITEKDMDSRNKTHHVEVLECYDSLNNTRYTKSMDLFTIHSDYVAIKLNEGKHFTLFYKKGLFDKIDGVTLNKLLHQTLKDNETRFAGLVQS
jgi:hypothetical protein